MSAVKSQIHGTRLTDFLHSRSRGVGEARIAHRLPLDDEDISDVWACRMCHQRRRNRLAIAKWQNRPGPDAA